MPHTTDKRTSKELAHLLYLGRLQAKDGRSALDPTDRGQLAFQALLFECLMSTREWDYSGKARLHGVNIQAVTGPAGELIWYSPALPGRTVGITVARTHHIITICERLRIPVLADKANAGAGGTFQVSFKHHLGRSLTTRQAAVNRSHARLCFPVERAFARLKAWRIFRKARIGPNRLMSITKAILTLPVARQGVGATARAAVRAPTMIGESHLKSR